jgi:hypothetical protein
MSRPSPKIERLVAVALCALAASTVLAPSVARACLHGPRQGPKSVAVGEAGKEAIVLRRDGRLDLVFRVDFEAGGDLSKLGWIIPVPAAPDRYDAASPKLFEELAEAVSLEAIIRRPRRRTKSARGGGGGPSSRSITLRELPVAKAGPYTIEPLQATGAAGRRALVRWMEDNDFTPPPREMLDYYTERRWTFLAIRADAASGADSLGAKGELPPLHVSLPTDRAVYPLKLSNPRGSIPVRLYVLTAEPLSRSDLSGALERGFSAAACPAKICESHRVRPSPGRPGRPRPGGDRIELFRRTCRRTSCAVDEPGYRGAGLSRSHRGYRVDLNRVTAEEGPSALRSWLAEQGAFEEQSSWALKVLYNRFFNRGPGVPSKWDEDLSIPPIPDGERLMGQVETTSAVEAADAGAQDIPEERDFEPIDLGAMSPTATVSVERAPGSAPEDAEGGSASCMGCVSARRGGPGAPWGLLLGLATLGWATANRRGGRRRSGGASK